MPAEQRAPTTTIGCGPSEGVTTAAVGYSRDTKIRSLQRSLYRAAKASPRRAFHALHQHVHRADVLRTSWQHVRYNGGAGGVDGEEIASFEAKAPEELARLGEELRTGTYRPLPIRQVEIPKSATENRLLGIPSIRDRIVQEAIRIVLEPVLEARFYEHSYGFRPRRSAHRALKLTGQLLGAGYSHVLDLDIRRYFDSIPHGKLLTLLRRHVSDGRLLLWVKQVLKAPIQEPQGTLRKNAIGCPQGGPLSPLLANLYLDVVDPWMARNTRYKDVVWIRYADDGLLLSRRPVSDLRNRLERLLQRMGLTVHPEKTRVVDMSRVGSNLDFLGYRLARRRARSKEGYALLTYPSPRSLQRIRDALRRVIPSRGSTDVKVLVHRANQIFRGWTAYFVRSNLKHPFQMLDDFFCARVRGYLRRQRRSPGRGTRKYTDQWLRQTLGLFASYRYHVQIRFPRPNAAGGRGWESRMR